MASSKAGIFLAASVAAGLAVWTMQPSGQARPAQTRAVCLNSDKIVYTRGGRSRDEVTTPDDYNIPRPDNAKRWLPENPSGMILQENATGRTWTPRDLRVMSVLIGQGYIAVHSGAYDESDTQPRSVPGPIIRIVRPDDTTAVIAGIVRHGAEFDLTAKGQQADVWSQDNGLCAILS